MSKSPVVDSLSCADGYHMYYLFHDASGRYQLVDTPLGVADSAETLVGPSVELARESTGRAVTVGVYEVILDPQSSLDPDLITAERDLNATAPAADPMVVDVFSYDLGRIGTIGCDATVLVSGEKRPTNEMRAKIRRTMGPDEGGFRMFAPSFSIKLNRVGAHPCNDNEVPDL